jgi:hypothetical protein
MTGKQVVNRSLSTHITPKSKTTVIGSLKVPVRHIGLHLRHKFRVVDRARAAKVESQDAHAHTPHVSDMATEEK